MSETNVNSGKRIAKNTIMLYFRMLLLMLVTLYTSRVILNTLGVTDFGIYNIVGGVVILFSFLNTAMSNASQRFMSVGIGKGDKKYIQRIFSNSLISHFLLIGLVIVLAETIGLWFVNTQLDIPYNRMQAANAVYQLTILTTCVNIIRVPYNACIIAYERMSFYAYIGITEVILKLAIVFLLQLFDFDKLIFYSCLFLLVTFIILIAHIIYCRRNMPENRFILKPDKPLLKEMLSFSGWNVFGGVADVAYKQGSNILLNIFYGVTLNSAMGITNQIRAAVYTFVSNLQVAANPQIIKSYTANDTEYFKTLVFRISKYSFYLMLFFAIPLILNMDYILKIWLKNPPEYTQSFSILILIFCLIDSLTGPLWVAMQATGRIKTYQIATSTALLSNLPLSYIALKLGISPNSVLTIQILVAVLTLQIRLIFAKKYNDISVSSYMRHVVLPIISVAVCSIPLPLLAAFEFTGLSKLISTGAISIVCVLIFVYTVGINCSERTFINRIIRQKILNRL